MQQGDEVQALCQVLDALADANKGLELASFGLVAKGRQGEGRTDDKVAAVMRFDNEPISMEASLHSNFFLNSISRLVPVTQRLAPPSPLAHENSKILALFSSSL